MAKVIGCGIRNVWGYKKSSPPLRQQQP